MISHPKTIQIFLPGGDPRGIRVSEITTRIVQVIEVPRSLLQDFLQMPESSQVALYFLFGEAEDGTGQRVYIGQTGDPRTRLIQHQKEKDFWERALVLVSKTNSLITNHALFLEWHCLQAAGKAGRYTLENGNSGTKPHTPAPLEAECLEIFETGQVLLATLGYPLFDPVAAPAPGPGKEERFLCTVDGVRGEGLYTQEGFVVLKGSVGKRADARSLVGHSYETLKPTLIEAGVLEVRGDEVVFVKDHLFKKPSPAAVALLGKPSNGWEVWKSPMGRTLNELKRQAPL